MTSSREFQLIAAEAFRLWQAQRLPEAAARFEEALAGLPDSEPGRATLHGQLGSVFAQLGRIEDSIHQSEHSLAAELAQGESNASPSVKVARYFLAERLVQAGRRLQALEAINPSLLVLPDDWLLNVAKAQVLHSIGKFAEAQAVAKHAIANASSDEKRAELQTFLAGILNTAAR